MPYTSNPGGLFNSGVFPDSRPRVDVGGALDALTSGATSLIHGAMLRRQAENQMALEQQRAAHEAAYQDQQLGLERERLSQAAIAERHRAMESGVVPESDVLTTTPTPATIQAPMPSPVAATSPIAHAMTAQDLQPQLTPARPDPFHTTIQQPAVQTVPEHFDPEASMRLAVTRLQGENALFRTMQSGQNQLALEDRRAAHRDAQLKFSNETRVRVAQIGANSRTAVHGAMTGDAKARRAAAVADGIIEVNEGNIGDALDNLQEDKAAQDMGVTPEELTAAYGRWRKSGFSAGIRLQSGATGQTPEEAGVSVQRTREVTRGQPAAHPNAQRKPVPTPSATAKPAAGAAPARRPLSARDKQNAKTDPKFRAFLKSKGYSDSDWK